MTDLSTSLTTHLPGKGAAHRPVAVFAGDDGDELLDVLDRAACERLLAATDYGRLAVVVEGAPRIVVLNHLVRGGMILLRTREDSLLARLTAGGLSLKVAYEVDSAFEVGRSAWSVIVRGRLVREADPERLQLARDHVQAWAGGDRDTVLRLQVETLDGRRVGRL